MSFVDLLLGKAFSGAKCKTLLKLTISRIKLLRNKREIQLNQMKKEIAQFLQAGQEATARIRVEHIIREQNILAAYEIVELFSELLAVRLPIIEAQRECPLDLREAIASLIFAAPRCSDLPELLHIRNLFVAKYGKEFVAAAAELRPDCGVNRQIIEKLSVRAPDAEIKLKTLKEIAEEHEVGWDSSATEAEFFKLHEDLLDGSNHILSGVKVPLNVEEENESHPTSVKLPVQGPISETSDDVLDLPEVPSRAVSQRRESQNVAMTGSQSPIARSHQVEQVSSKFTYSRSRHDTMLQVASSQLLSPGANKSLPTSSSFTSTDMAGEKQFVPFISSSAPIVAVDKKEEIQACSISSPKAKTAVDFPDVIASAQAAVAAADRAAAAARAAADLAKVKIFDFKAKTPHGISRGGSESTFIGRER